MHFHHNHRKTKQEVSYEYSYKVPVANTKLIYTAHPGRCKI